MSEAATSEVAPPASDAEQSCVEQLLAQVSDDDIEVLAFRCEAKEATMARFSRARGYDAVQALQMVNENIAWRRERSLADMQTKSPQEILGGLDPAVIHRYFGQHILGFHEGVLVKFALCGHIDAAALTAVIDDDSFINYFIWQQERQLDMITDYQNLTGSDRAWQFVTIADMDGYSMRSFSAPARRVARVLAPILSDSYPETVATTILINSPTIFSVTWRFLSMFIDSVTRSRTIITSSNGGEEIFARVPPAVLPVSLGGELEGNFGPDVPPGFCPFLLEHTTFGKALIARSEPKAVRGMLLARHAYRKRVFALAGKEWPGPEQGEVSMPDVPSKPLSVEPPEEEGTKAASAEPVPSDTGREEDQSPSAGGHAV